MCHALNYHSRRNENLRAEKRPGKEERLLRRRYPEYAFPYPRSGYTDKRDAYLLLIAFSNITTWQLRPITLLLRKHTRMCLILSKLSTLIESCRLSYTSIFSRLYWKYSRADWNRVNQRGRNSNAHAGAGPFSTAKTSPQEA